MSRLEGKVVSFNRLRVHLFRGGALPEWQLISVQNRSDVVSLDKCTEV
jgi:hypothetical protein